MREVGEKLYTPSELEEMGLLSRVQQWQERKAGRLGAYHLGRKILYGQRHLDDFLALCERRPQKLAA